MLGIIRKIFATMLIFNGVATVVVWSLVKDISNTIDIIESGFNTLAPNLGTSIKLLLLPLTTGSQNIVYGVFTIVLGILLLFDNIIGYIALAGYSGYILYMQKGQNVTNLFTALSTLFYFLLMVYSITMSIYKIGIYLSNRASAKSIV